MADRIHGPSDVPKPQRQAVSACKAASKAARAPGHTTWVLHIETLTEF